MPPLTPEPIPPKERGIRRFFTMLGPGLIAGAADDDPSGIATYTQTGATFGYGMLWTSLYQLPFLLAIQEACGRIGAVTGEGLTSVLKKRYSKSVVMGVVGLVALANVINIGADLAAVAAAVHLVLPFPITLIAVATAVLIIVLEVFLCYATYAKVLKWFALALIAYPLTALLVAEPWKEILVATFVPHIEFTFQFLFLITGVLGTTISPYMFFWQASAEVEEEDVEGVKIAEDGRPELPRRYLARMRIDTLVGMLASEVVQWFIIISAGTILFANGVTHIGSAADAALALEPLVSSFPHAGYLAKVIFAIGIVGLGLLGIPVLAGSAAYAVAEAFSWKEGLGKKFRDAKAFYYVIIIATVLGLIMNLAHVDPIKALVFTAVFNGIAAVPLIFLIARMNESRAVLGSERGGPLSRIFVWATFALMAASAIGLVASYFL